LGFSDDPILNSNIFLDEDTTDFPFSWTRHVEAVEGLMYFFASFSPRAMLEPIQDLQDPYVLGR
jgi:hypothetical protein